eukprot:TRINITY_DN784_c0_g1_i2.p1 TRINITY_DN784_c0_g1~~TRINITY_DN784_c0_g1_i2.p1  ORF type:complete len:218 (+),score=67.78 TRINITY_DN784_c0_g1_i2:38-691(+)
MKNRTKCEICLNNNSKYICPKCRIKYCSKDCFILHQNNGLCESKQNSTAIQTPSFENIKNPSKKNIRTVKQTDPLIISNEQLELLRNNKSILDKVSHSHLQAVLSHLIDNSKNKLQTLNDLIENDKHFEQFCVEVLQTIKYEYDLDKIEQNIIEDSMHMEESDLDENIEPLEASSRSFSQNDDILPLKQSPKEDFIEETLEITTSNADELDIDLLGY